MKSKDQEDKELAEAIGKRITELRKANLLSQVALAERVGIRQAPLSNIEQGKCLPSTPVLIGLAQALGASVDEILGMGTAEMTLRATDPAIYICGDVACESVAAEALRTAVAHSIRPMGFELTNSVAEDVASAIRRALGMEGVIHLDLQAHLCWEGFSVVEMTMDAPFALYTNSDATRAVLVLSSALSENERSFALATALARLAIAARDVLMHEKIETLQNAKERVATSIALAFLMPNTLVSRYIAYHGMPSEASYPKMAETFHVSVDRLKQRLTLLGM